MRRIQELLRKLSLRWEKRIAENREKAQRSFLRSHRKRFQQFIGYSIRNEDLFVQALLHRSFLQRMGHVGPSNERLEFLGDSVLNLVVAEYLFHHFPEAEEGDLTKMRSRLVNRKALASYGKELHLFEFVQMSESAAHSGVKGSDTIISDTFEAVVAAIYLDGGFNHARRFVRGQLDTSLAAGIVHIRDENYKSRLLEFSQARGMGIPRYSTLHQEGPDHDRTFTIEVLLNNKPHGTGVGKNKKEAEQAAAKEALRTLRKTEDSNGADR